MATDPVLRMLGLARRAGKLTYGDERWCARRASTTRPAVCSLRVTPGKCSEKSRILRREGECSVRDVAARQDRTRQRRSARPAARCCGSGHRTGGSSRKKTGGRITAYAEVAAAPQRKERTDPVRRGIKKHKNKAEKTEKRRSKNRKIGRGTEAEARTFRKPSGEKASLSEDDENSVPYRKADGEKRPYRKDSESRPYRKNGEASSVS